MNNISLFPFPFSPSREICFSSSSFHHSSCQLWLRSHHSSFLAIIFTYLATIFGLKFAVLHLRPLQLRRPLALWNALLAVFSAFGFWRTFPTLVAVIRSRGFVFSYTQISAVYIDPVSGFWTLLWVLSKVPELLDTLFIVLRRRPLRFMHWFHHAMSILFGTINYAGANAYLVWVVCMNFFIHALMYSYYFAKSMNIHPPKKVAQLITTLQIIQFLVILLQLGHIFFLHNFGGGVHCAISPGGFTIGLFTTSVYIKLWIQFYRDQYWRKKEE